MLTPAITYSVMFYALYQLAATKQLAMLYGSCCEMLFDKGKESAKDEALSPALVVNGSCPTCNKSW